MYSALHRIPLSLGVSRIVPCPLITCLMGDPARPPADERDLRVAMLRRGLAALQTPVDAPTTFA
jgi:glycine reductase